MFGKLDGKLTCVLFIWWNFTLMELYFDGTPL